MGRVLVRDQYFGEHWINEASLAYAPWRDCEVIGREAEPDAGSEAVSPDTPASTQADARPTEPSAGKPRKPAAQ